MIDVELVELLVKNKPTTRLIKQLEENLKNFSQLKIKTTHRFLDGMYSREVFMPKGSIIISKTHKLENLTIISKGKCLEVTEKYERRVIVAPYTLISPPNIKRALYILEDTVWTTIHHNPDNTTCLDELEHRITEPDDCLIESEVKKWLGLL